MPVAIPPQFEKDADGLPPVLRTLLDLELAAGNSIAEVGHTFPAAPCGVFFRLAHPVTTWRRESGNGVVFRTLSGSGSFSDEDDLFFILEPPVPPPEEPDMDAIRAAHTPKPFEPAAPVSALEGAAARFERSMAIDYIKWHDGIGYDLDAIREANETERRAIESLLLRRGVRDWRDVEALAVLATPRATQALSLAARHSDPEIRMAVLRCAPEIVPETERTQSLVKALETARFTGGLSQALDQAGEFHPAAVMDALLRGALRREGECAVHFAALLLFLHGKAESAFDWAQRPFFLRFRTEDRAARQAVFGELCERIGVDAGKYL